MRERVCWEGMRVKGTKRGVNEMWGTEYSVSYVLNQRYPFIALYAEII